MVSTPLKNISQIGNLPQVGVKMKNIWNHHPDYYYHDYYHNLQNPQTKTPSIFQVGIFPICTSNHSDSTSSMGWRSTQQNKALLLQQKRWSYGCFRKWWYPQIIQFNRDFHHKSSILGYSCFWKHPYGFQVYKQYQPSSRPRKKGVPRPAIFFGASTYIWLFLMLKYGKCRSIYHTWMLWVRIGIQHVFKGYKYVWTAANKKNVKKARLCPAFHSGWPTLGRNPKSRVII